MSHTFGFREQRTRVVFHLPNEVPAHTRALDEILGYLRRQRKSREAAVDGYTRTVNMPPTNIGSWVDDGKWVDEHVALITVDYDVDLESPRLSKAILRMRKRIQQAYKNQQGRQEKVIWIVANRISRFVR